MLELYKDLYGEYPSFVKEIADVKLSENSDINVSVADNKVLGKLNMKF